MGNLANDRFQFRVWNLEELCDVEGWEQNASGLLLHLWRPESSDHIETYFHYTWTIEQCTGLKDKNGELIYEGDILKSQGGWLRVPVVVKFGEGTFDMGVYTFQGFYLERLDGHQLEEWGMFHQMTFGIIGNIHEDKHLLDDKSRSEVK